MKKFTILAALLAMFFFQAQAKNYALPSDQLAYYQPIPVEDGMTLSVTLPDDGILRVPLKENPTTGYQWDVRVEDDNACLKVVGKSFYPPKGQLPPHDKKSKHHHDRDEEPPRLAGAPGMKIFTLKAEHRGTAVLHFRHARNWEHDAEKEFTMIVFITED